MDQMQPMDGHFYTKDEETHWVISLLFLKFPYHFQFCFLVVVGIAVVNDVTVDIVVGVAVVVVFLWPWWPDQSFIVLFSSGFSRPPNTHIKQYFPCKATSGKSSESPFSILSVHFLLCVPSCGRCLHTVGAFRLSTLVRLCQDNVRKETEEWLSLIPCSLMHCILFHPISVSLSL